MLAEMGVEGLLQLQQDEKALTEAVAEAVQVPPFTLITYMLLMVVSLR